MCHKSHPVVHIAGGLGDRTKFRIAPRSDTEPAAVLRVPQLFGTVVSLFRIDVVSGLGI